MTGVQTCALPILEIHQIRFLRAVDCPASMGPRARARGNLTRKGVCALSLTKLQWGHERALVEMRALDLLKSKHAGLQWGHERALVEMPIPWLTSKAFLTLQWGHERALVEITCDANIESVEMCASMGPRARARGNATSLP